MRLMRADMATAAAARVCDHCGGAIAAHCEYHRIAAFDGERAGFARAHIACNPAPARLAAYASAPTGGAEVEDADVVAFFERLGVGSELFCSVSAAVAPAPVAPKPRSARELVDVFGGVAEMSAIIRRDAKAILAWMRSHHVGAESLTRIRLEARRVGVEMTSSEIRRLFDDERRQWREAQCGQ